MSVTINDRESREKKARCDNCRKIGHFKKHCPLLVPVSTPLPVSIPPSTPPAPKPISTQACSLCKNHTNEQCPYQNKTLDNETDLREFLVQCWKFDRFNIELVDHSTDMPQTVSLTCTTKVRCREGRTARVQHVDHPSPLTKSIQKILDVDTMEEIIDVIKRFNFFQSVTYNLTTLTYRGVLKTLKEKKVIDYTYVAEDKRSGCNLIKYLRINNTIIDKVIIQTDPYEPQLIKMYEEIMNVDTQPLFHNIQKLELKYV